MLRIFAKTDTVYPRAHSLLKQLYGPDAEFRDGQYEAIHATMTHRRTLVVQRTGWGKSLVYFICTKLNRSEGKGVTFVISPLLVLMSNQIEAAEKLGIRCDMLNSRTKDRRDDILRSIRKNELDLVLITPETLFADDIQTALKDFRIGLFVIDEAHCISDWGHDFRLDYCRLNSVISRMPKTVPILATTATANDRVVEDLKAQLGGDVHISRGPLSRESLWIQTINLPTRAQRYAWLLENIPRIPGSGIIYCLTQRDCDYLADFLQKNGIRAMSYHSGRLEKEQQNQIAEQLFQRNEIKAMVATVKLGMGYDKGDISFVIHFQMPQNIVSYYQQIGRAGRSIPAAYAVLLGGQEDADILDYFIRTAFPTRDETGSILKTIRSREGASIPQLCADLNIRRARIEKAVSFLYKDGFLYKQGSKYYVSPKPFHYDSDHYNAITDRRIREKDQMQRLLSTKICLSKYIVTCLDDRSAENCGRCPNCLGRNIFPETVSPDPLQKAEIYLGSLIFPITPRKQLPAFGDTRGKMIRCPNQEGICLSKYGDPGFGELVKQGKYLFDRFCDELVGKSADVLRPFVEQHGITHITFVPSLRSALVEDFAHRLGSTLRLPVLPLLTKHPADQQKDMENASYQFHNAWQSFEITPGAVVPKKVLLIDDVIDSKWTITVCGYKLTEAGCREVYPFALADSSTQGD